VLLPLSALLSWLGVGFWLLRLWLAWMKDWAPPENVRAPSLPR